MQGFWKNKAGYYRKEVKGGPYLINRRISGDRKKASCISCNMCLFKPRGIELSCTLDNRETKDRK